MITAKTKKYPYRTSISLSQEAGAYLEQIVKEGHFQSIGHALRVAVNGLWHDFPTAEEVERERDEQAKRKLGIGED